MTGVGKGGKVPTGFRNVIIAINFSVEKCFSLSFGVGKMKFHHCRPPHRKNLLATSWTNPLLVPLEKNPSDAHG